MVGPMVGACRHPFANLLAMDWSERVSGLRSLLHSDPSNPRAAWWQIRVRILTFLLARYGDVPTSKPTAQRKLSPTSWIAPGPQFESGKPIRSAACFRAILERIAEANQDRL